MQDRQLLSQVIATIYNGISAKSRLRNNAIYFFVERNYLISWTSFPKRSLRFVNKQSLLDVSFAMREEAEIIVAIVIGCSSRIERHAESAQLFDFINRQRSD